MLLLAVVVEVGATVAPVPCLHV
uniref:Uncharacterized protein n=1 Tax=Arundo donax TaxID=35708 RepID=A0A0A8ZKN5_ARUDO